MEGARERPEREKRNGRRKKKNSEKKAPKKIKEREKNQTHTHLKQRQPRAHSRDAPGDDAELGRHGRVAVGAGPELGERKLEGLVLLDAVIFFGEVEKRK